MGVHGWGCFINLWLIAGLITYIVAAAIFGPPTAWACVAGWWAGAAVSFWWERRKEER